MSVLYRILVAYGVALELVFLFRVLTASIVFSGGAFGWASLYGHRIWILGDLYRIQGFETASALAYIVIVCYVVSVSMLILSIIYSSRDRELSVSMLYSSAIAYTIASIASRVVMSVMGQQVIIIQRIVSDRSNNAGLIDLPNVVASYSPGFQLVLGGGLILLSISYMLLSLMLMLREARD